MSGMSGMDGMLGGMGGPGMPPLGGQQWGALEQETPQEPSSLPIGGGMSSGGGWGAEMAKPPGMEWGGASGGMPLEPNGTDDPWKSGGGRGNWGGMGEGPQSGSAEPLWANQGGLPVLGGPSWDAPSSISSMPPISSLGGLPHKPPGNFHGAPEGDGGVGGMWGSSLGWQGGLQEGGGANGLGVPGMPVLGGPHGGAFNSAGPGAFHSGLPGGAPGMDGMWQQGLSGGSGALEGEPLYELDDLDLSNIPGLN